MDATLSSLSENPFVGRQDPNPEADAFWAEWENMRTIVVTVDEIKNPSGNLNSLPSGASEAWKYFLLNAEVIFIGGKVPSEILVHVKET